MQVKKYSEFVNEELTKGEKFILKNLPYIIGNRLISSLLGAAPLLSSKWESLKNKTKGEWNYYGGTPGLIKNPLKEIKLSDLPNTPLKKGLYPIFNNWNIYDAGENKEGRKIFYISKDKLKEGDNVISSREINWEIGDKKIKYQNLKGKTISLTRKETKDDPVFILAAKYDIDEFLHTDVVEDIKMFMNDEIQDNGISINEIKTSLENDIIFCKFKLNSNYDYVTMNSEIISYLITNSKRVSDFLESNTDKKWNYSIQIKPLSITKENQLKLINHYQKDPNFWKKLVEYGIYIEDSSPGSFSRQIERILKRSHLYSHFFKYDNWRNYDKVDGKTLSELSEIKYALEKIFGSSGNSTNIYFCKNSKQIIEPFDIENLRINSISVQFKLQKDATS
jgi:hypothetical protein